MSERWTAWIEHPGDGCALPIGTRIEVEGQQNGAAIVIRHTITASDYQRPNYWWKGDQVRGRVKQYRVWLGARAVDVIEGAIAAAAERGGK
jgi:hypothetical protein